MTSSKTPGIGQVVAPYSRIKFSIAMVFITLVAIWFLKAPPISAAHASQPGQSKTTLAANQQNQALGLNHFEAHCASCHALSGKADNEKGKAVGAADLTSQEVQSKSDAELMKIIQNGVKGTAMPAFSKSHKPAEIKQIIAFLRKLPTLTAEERKQLEDAVPASARHKHGASAPHEDGHDHPGQVKKPAEDPQHDHPGAASKAEPNKAVEQKTAAKPEPAGQMKDNEHAGHAHEQDVRGT